MRVDKKLYVACCACLGYASTENMRWHGDAYLCGSCWTKVTTGNALNVGVIGSGTAIKCKQCRRLKRADEEYFSTTVLSDQTMRFVQIYFCERDIRKKSWLFSSPNYQSLSTVELGIKADWSTLKQWDPRRDYMNANIDMDMDSKLLRQVRRFMGAMAIDGDGEEADDDEADGDEAAKEHLVAMEAETQSFQPAKARKTGIARGKNGSAIRMAM